MIEVVDLSFGYEGRAQVLENVNFSVQPGELLALFGPNGGGKTTLMKLLMGFLKPTKGKIEILGKSPEEVRCKIGYVPQQAPFDRDFPLTLLEFVLMGKLSSLSPWGRYPQEAKERALELLELFGLYLFRHAPLSSLSGGQLQKALLARALLSSPELLILDEATSNIDPHAEAQIARELQRLKGRMTILFVTHHLPRALSLADRLLCIDRRATFFQKEEVCSHFSLGLYHGATSDVR